MTFPHTQRRFNILTAQTKSLITTPSSHLQERCTCHTGRKSERREPKPFSSDTQEWRTFCGDQQRFHRELVPKWIPLSLLFSLAISNSKCDQDPSGWKGPGCELLPLPPGRREVGSTSVLDRHGFKSEKPLAGKSFRRAGQSPTLNDVRPTFRHQTPASEYVRRSWDSRL